jgi:hypothetical protein
MQELIAGLFVMAIMVGLFLLFRHAVLWYWKINEIVELLKAIKEK